MKILLTKELGRLAKWLRILGIDAVYFRQDNASSLIIEALRQERVIVTRNHRLQRPTGVRIIMIGSEKIKEQLAEVLKVLNIKPASDKMFSRCTVCNDELISIEKEKIRDKVPEYVFKTQDSFTACPDCKRIYWRGTHWGNVENILKEIVE